MKKMISQRSSAFCFLLGVSGLAICPAWGQAVTEAPVRANAAVPGDAIADIVVTAQRRDQRLQDVPIAVTAMAADSLARAQVQAIYDLQTQVPALVINRYGNATVTFIRGVGSVDGTPGSEGAVALYVDGVYHAAPFTSGIDFNNIARVEVLKGPQGTLFGRNATGGAIQIITRDPSFDSSMAGSLAYGSYSTVDGRFYATTGLSDKVAADIAVSYHNQSKGFGRNLATGTEVLKDKNFSIRSKFLFNLTEDLSVTLTGQYYILKNRSDTRKPPPGTILLDGSTYASTGGFYDVRQDLDPYFRARGKEVSAYVKYDAGPVRLVSITAFQKAKTLSFFDQDGAPSPQVNLRMESTFRTLTQELQLLSQDDSAIKWIIGGFFMKDRSGFGGRNGLTLYGPFVGGQFGIIAPITTTSYSAFAEATFPLGEATRLTAGARYSRDERTIRSYTNVLDASTNNILLTIPGAPQSATFTKPTWRAIIDHHFTPEIMAYASVSRGFKSGNFNAVSPSSPSFEPEVLTAYEAGVKTEFFDRHLRLNLSGYYYKYNNMQLVIVLGTTQQTVNAGKAELGGAEAEAQIVFGNGLNLNLSAALADSKFLRYRDGVCFVPKPAGGNFSLTCDHTGERLPKSPKLTFNVSPSYTLETDIGEFVATVSWYHTSQYRFEPSGFVFQKKHDLVNGQISWTAPDEHYGLAVFVKNATKTRYSQYAFGQALGDSFSPAPPRTFGVEANIKF
jgi:iron complex outermembrane receptor protein